MTHEDKRLQRLQVQDDHIGRRCASARRAASCGTRRAGQAASILATAMARRRPSCAWASRSSGRGLRAGRGRDDAFAVGLRAELDAASDDPLARAACVTASPRCSSRSNCAATRRATARAAHAGSRARGFRGQSLPVSTPPRRRRPAVAARGEALVVGHEHEGRAVVLRQPQHGREHAVGGLAVEVAGRLVGEHAGRPRDEGARATRWRSPPESSDGRCATRSARPTCASTAAACAARPRAHRAGCAAASRRCPAR